MVKRATVRKKLKAERRILDDGIRKRRSRYNRKGEEKMKAFICSIILLCSVVLSSILVAVYANKALTEFGNTIDTSFNSGITDTENAVREIESEYSRLKPFLILFIREDDIQEIETHIVDIKSAAAENDHTSLTEAKSRLKLHIEQIRRLSVFSIEAIF